MNRRGLSRTRKHDASTAMFVEMPLPEGRGWWDLAAMIAFTLLLAAIAVTRQRRIMKWEGMLLLVCYAAYMTYSVARELM